MKIKAPRTRVHYEHYLRMFNYADLPGVGYAFECDKDGNVDVSKLTKCGADNYAQCLTGEKGAHKIIDGGAQDYSKTVYEPAVGECNRCGEEVALYGFTNTCECGADYNMSGQELCPRQFWGEETGENLSDILGVDYTDPDLSGEGY